MKNHFLGKWAVIDIETTGINPVNEKIIDVGFLKFEGLELVEKYQSLVNYQYELPQFIKKLTGISEKQLKVAPDSKEVFLKLSELEGYDLLAHNSSFEESFFEGIIDHANYQDSMIYLPILFPKINSLKLENWLIHFNLSDSEIHRGYEDSLDLLRTILLTTYLSKSSRVKNSFLKNLWKTYLNDSFWQKFYSLEIEEIKYLAKQIDLDLDQYFEPIDQFLDPNLEMIESDVELNFSGQSIDAILSDEKYLGQFLTGYQKRDGQVEMSKRVGQTFKHNIHSLIEAPTGTGKTLGYLVPAALYSKEKDQQVLVATATKTLQKQIIDKDLPVLKNIFDKKEINCVKLIGTSNHFCELAFQNSLQDEIDLFDFDKFDNKDEDKFNHSWSLLYFENLFQFNKDNKNTKSNKNQMTSEDVQYALIRKNNQFKKMEEQLRVDFRTCIGKNCPHKQNCSYLNGLASAKEADIIVANHALLFSWPNSLVMPSKVIVDEAHKIEHSVTSSFTEEFFIKDFDYFIQNLSGGRRLGSLKYLIKVFNLKMENDFDKSCHDFAQLIHDHHLLIEEKVELLFKAKARFSELYWNESELEPDKKKINNQIELEIYNSIDSLNFIFLTISKFFEQFWGIKEQIDFKDEEKTIAWNSAEYLLSKIDDTSHFFNKLMHGDLKFVYTLSFHQMYGSKLNIEPIDCGQILKENFLEKISASVFTSATIGIGQNKKAPLGIQWATGQLYLEGKKRFLTDLSLPPFFDYANRAKVFLCNDVPSLNSIDFIPEVLTKVSKLIKNINGKSLLLFSSKVRFNKACEFLLSQFKDDLTLFIQGMGANVVEEFRNCDNGILIGLESFGEGIDIPGEQLQFVFIDKIPDIRQDLVIKRRREFFQSSFGNEFENYFMASRERSLLQKLGRLLRTSKDFGGAIIVDSRTSRWKSFTINKFFINLYPYDIQKSPLNDACHKLESFIKDFN